MHFAFNVRRRLQAGCASCHKQQKPYQVTSNYNKRHFGFGGLCRKRYLLIHPMWNHETKAVGHKREEKTIGRRKKTKHPNTAQRCAASIAIIQTTTQRRPEKAGFKPLTYNPLFGLTQPKTKKSNATRPLCTDPPPYQYIG